MVDISAIAGVMTALRGVTDISKAMIDLRDGAMIQAKVIELQGAILAAQSSAFAAQDERAALIARVSELEKEVASLKAWDAEKQNYELKDIGNGVLAYALKTAFSLTRLKKACREADRLIKSVQTAIRKVANRSSSHKKQTLGDGIISHALIAAKRIGPMGVATIILESDQLLLRGAVGASLSSFLANFHFRMRLGLGLQ
jgi:hypothetical protein